MPTLLDIEVGLLIGFNCSQALAPYRVILGEDGEPYGQKSVLGWSIVGSPSAEDQKCSVCHRISFKEIPAVT